MTAFSVSESFSQNPTINSVKVINALDKNADNTPTFEKKVNNKDINMIPAVGSDNTTEEIIE